jgi:hypothetical protein
LSASDEPETDWSFWRTIILSLLGMLGLVILWQWTSLPETLGLRRRRGRY